MAMDKRVALRRIDAVAGLPKAVLEELASVSGLQRIGRGATMFCEGESAHFVYAIIEGRVTLVNGKDGGETVVDFLEAGDLILIPPALLGLPYMATGRASTDVLALLIPAADFCRLAKTELSLSVAINRVLSQHWRLLLRHLTQTKTGDADTRVVQYLLDNIDADATEATLTLPGSKRELAAHLGMSPETLSRTFKRLSELGVTSDGSEITINSVSRLDDFSRRHHSPQGVAPAATR